jgi:hypothetical protein
MDGIFSSASASTQRPGTKGFRAWLAKARAGDRVTYFIGFLAAGTGPNGALLPAADRHEVFHEAQIAWAAAERGLVHLLQRRLGQNCFEYLAVARPQAAAHDHHRT